MTAHRHRWDRLGLQKLGTVRTCQACGELQVKRERSDGLRLEAYWRLADPLQDDESVEPAPIGPAHARGFKCDCDECDPDRWQVSR